MQYCDRNIQIYLNVVKSRIQYFVQSPFQFASGFVHTNSLDVETSKLEDLFERR
jgi:hypothetical protein